MRKVQVTPLRLIIENGKLKIGVLMNNIIETKSFDFAVRIVKLYKFFV